MSAGYTTGRYRESERRHRSSKKGAAAGAFAVSKILRLDRRAGEHVIILGIDPGVTGALVWLDVQANAILAVSDHSAWCNAHDPEVELRALLKASWVPDIVIIEAQHARLSRDPVTKKVLQGISSTWNYAEHYGIIRGCAAAYDRPIRRVDPGTWKGSMHLGNKTEKRKSLELARKLWPQSLPMFKRKMDHGRAEAALLAYYGRRFLPLPAPVKRRVL